MASPSRVTISGPVRTPPGTGKSWISFLLGQSASKAGGAIVGVLIPSALAADGLAAVSRKDGMNIAYWVI